MFELQSVKNVYKSVAKKYPDAVIEQAYTDYTQYNVPKDDEEAHKKDIPADRGSKGLSYNWLTLLNPDGMPITVGDYFHPKTFKPLYNITYSPIEAQNTEHYVAINQSHGWYSAELREIDDSSHYDGDYYYGPYNVRWENLSPWRLHRIVKELTNEAIVLTAEQSHEIQHIMQANNRVTPSEVWDEFIPLAASLKRTRAV
jgi:hypothetical protein